MLDGFWYQNHNVLISIRVIQIWNLPRGPTCQLLKQAYCGACTNIYGNTYSTLYFTLIYYNKISRDMHFTCLVRDLKHIWYDRNYSISSVINNWQIEWFPHSTRLYCRSIVRGVVKKFAMRLDNDNIFKLCYYHFQVWTFLLSKQKWFKFLFSIWDRKFLKIEYV